MKGILFATIAFILCGCGAGAVDPGSLVDSSDTPTLVSTNADSLSPYHLTVSPAPIATSTTPSVSGYASVGDQVKLFLSSSCTGNSISSTIVDSTGKFSLASSVLTVDGRQKYSVMAIHADGTSTCSSNYVSYILDRSGPLISSFPSDQTVSSFPSSFQFALADTYSGVGGLTTNNSNGELTFSGCTGGGGGASAQPTATIDSSKKPLFTVHLSGGNCQDGDVLAVTLHANKLSDSIGNLGLSTNSLTVNYHLALTAPGITLVRHDGLSNPINHSASLVLDVGFVHASGGSTTLVTDASNAAGRVNLSGASSGCVANVQMGAGISGGTVTLSGCTGNGNLVVSIQNSLVQNAASIAGSGFTVLNLIVDNQGPTLSQSMTAASNYVSTLDGANTVTFIVNDANGVNTLSADNSGQEIVVTGNCSVPPSVATSTSDGVTYVITLSGGTCADGNSIRVALDPTKLVDPAGNDDTSDTQTAQTVNYSIDMPAHVLLDIGGDDGNPTTVQALDSGANFLVIYMSKNMVHGNGTLYCGVDYNSLVQIAVGTPIFGMNGTVSWSISDIVSANSSNPFTSGFVCTMDVSALQDANGVRVDGNTGTSVTSNFSVN